MVAEGTWVRHTAVLGSYQDSSRTWAADGLAENPDSSSLVHLVLGLGNHWLAWRVGRYEVA